MTDFRRENRYVVAKRKDILRYLSASEEKQLGRLLEKIEAGRKTDNRPSLICVVVESDWPEYEPTWAAIKRRMTGDNLNDDAVS